MFFDHRRRRFTHQAGAEGGLMPNVCEAEPLSLHHAAEALEQEIVMRLDEHTVLNLDVLVSLMSRYSWNQIFHAVDRLARSGRIVLRRHRFDYTLFSRHYAA
jgi:hypothetical protein